MFSNVVIVIPLRLKFDILFSNLFGLSANVLLKTKFIEKKIKYKMTKEFF